MKKKTNKGAFICAVFTPCFGSLGDNMAADCNNPRVSGYEDVAIIMNRDDIDWASVTENADNPRIITSLAMKEGKKPYVIYNPRVSPAAFNGTQAAFNQEGNNYDKTVQFYYEGIGGGAAKNVVEPLKSGNYVVILQRKDHKGDGSFQIVGYQSGLIATAQVQDEDTGYWLMTMTAQESYAEMSFFKENYASTKTAFDALLASV